MGVAPAGVLDFIGSELTGTMPVRYAAVGGSVVVLGAGDGRVRVGFMSVPFDLGRFVVVPGTSQRALELVEMATREQRAPRATTFCSARERSAEGRSSCRHDEPAHGRDLLAGHSRIYRHLRHVHR